MGVTLRQGDCLVQCERKVGEREPRMSKRAKCQTASLPGFSLQVPVRTSLSDGW